MPRTEWTKIPRVTRICACGCGELTTGTKRRMYAKPYCKLKAHLQRKKDPNFIPDPKFNPRPNPLLNVSMETLKEISPSMPTNWWKERFANVD